MSSDTPGIPAPTPEELETDIVALYYSLPKAGVVDACFAALTAIRLLHAERRGRETERRLHAQSEGKMMDKVRELEAALTAAEQQQREVAERERDEEREARNETLAALKLSHDAKVAAEQQVAALRAAAVQAQIVLETIHETHVGPSTPFSRATAIAVKCIHEVLSEQSGACLDGEGDCLTCDGVGFMDEQQTSPCKDCGATGFIGGPFKAPAPPSEQSS